MNTLKKLIDLNMKRQNFDYLALGIIDFKANQYHTLASARGNLAAEWQQDYRQTYFDLASVSKPLNLALSNLIRPDLFDESMIFLLEHRAGLPAWGRLSHQGWKEQLLSYKLSAAPTEYSDFGALRLMLELEKKLGHGLKQLVSAHWDKEVCFWKDLPDGAISAPTGMRRGDWIVGEVHDDNAKVIDDYTSHAGLFGTIDGVCRTLIGLQQNHHLLSHIQSAARALPPEQRFVRGWDRVLNPQNTLAGAGCSSSTFGHLGFTGTSIWIDAEAQLGHVILTNGTVQAWYQKEGLNELRRLIGQWVWTKYRQG